MEKIRGATQQVCFTAYAPRMGSDLQAIDAGCIAIKNNNNKNSTKSSTGLNFRGSSRKYDAPGPAQVDLLRGSIME